jgi:hypothetical protein
MACIESSCSGVDFYCSCTTFLLRTVHPSIQLLNESSAYCSQVQFSISILLEKHKNFIETSLIVNSIVTATFPLHRYKQCIMAFAGLIVSFGDLACGFNIKNKLLHISLAIQNG